MKRFILTAAAFAASTVVQAGEKLERARFKAFHEQEFTRNVANYAQICGARFTATIDWSTFRDADFGDYSIADRCGEAARPLITVCSDEIGRAAAREALTGFVCRRGDEAAADIGSDGVLDATVPLGGLTPYNYFADFFGDQL